MCGLYRTLVLLFARGIAVERHGIGTDRLALVLTPGFEVEADAAETLVRAISGVASFGRPMITRTRLLVVAYTCTARG